MTYPPPHPNLAHVSACSSSKMAAIFDKPEKLHYFKIIKRDKNAAFSPGVKLDLGRVKCLRVWPSPGVACHIQLCVSTQQKKCSHTCSYFLITLSVDKEQTLSSCLWIWTLLWPLCIRLCGHFCLNGRKMREEIQLLSSFLCVSGALWTMRLLVFISFLYLSSYPRWHFDVGIYRRKCTDYITRSSSRRRSGEDEPDLSPRLSVAAGF